MTSADYTLPDIVLHHHPGAWGIVGTGVFSWSVFKLYRASLYALGPFQSGSPFALDLTYLRNISSDQIVTTSMREIERLRTPTPDQARDWAIALLDIVPNVSLGFRLIGLFLPGKGVRFFNQNEYLGEILDAEFEQAFAAVWLDPETRSPALRASLLGQTS
jgi:hypothetical protein